MGGTMIGGVVGGEARGAIIGEDQDGMASASRRNERLLSTRVSWMTWEWAVCAGGHVADHGPINKDAEAGEFQVVDDACGLAGVAARADGDVQARGTGAAEGVHVAVVDFVVPADEGAVEVAGEDFPVGWHGGDRV